MRIRTYAMYAMAAAFLYNVPLVKKADSSVFDHYFSGEGFVLYSCAGDRANASPEWHPVGQSAMLSEINGNRLIRHFQQTWQASDSSTITGNLILSQPIQRHIALGWQLLHVAESSGQGILGRVGYITVTDTNGGVAPLMGCDNRHLGDVMSVSYTASYKFFPRGPEPRIDAPSLG